MLVLCNYSYENATSLITTLKNPQLHASSSAIYSSCKSIVTEHDYFCVRFVISILVLWCYSSASAAKFTTTLKSLKLYNYYSEISSLCKSIVPEYDWFCVRFTLLILFLWYYFSANATTLTTTLKNLQPHNSYSKIYSSCESIVLEHDTFYVRFALSILVLWCHTSANIATLKLLSRI